MLTSIANYTIRQCHYFGNCSFGRCAVAHDARQLDCFREPTTIVFLFGFNCVAHFTIFPSHLKHPKPIRFHIRMPRHQFQRGD